MILVVGCGFVGQTVAKSLEDDGQEVVRIDPKYNNNKIADYKDKAVCAIVAVPTPTSNDKDSPYYGGCDDSIIKEVLDELGPIRTLLKCTVPPDMLDKYPKNVTYNPEFLRAKTAQQDWDSQKFFILGGEPEECEWWARKFAYLPKQKYNFLDVTRFIFTDRKTASAIKYMHNCWLAMKVAFFHDMYNRLDKSIDYDKMIEVLGMFENIGPSHMKAPNDEGKLGYGGHCFPKDVQAFCNYTDSGILEKIIDTNRRLKDL